jgi:hypothetical protein
LEKEGISEGKPSQNPGKTLGFALKAAIADKAKPLNCGISSAIDLRALSQNARKVQNFAISPANRARLRV